MNEIKNYEPRMRNDKCVVILSKAKDLLPPSSREVARLAVTEGVNREAAVLFEE